MLRETSRETQFYAAGIALCVGLISVSAAHPAVRGVFVGSCLAAFALSVAVRRRADVSIEFVLALAVVFRLAVFWLPPVLSDDPFRYIWDGLLQTKGINPYLHVPDALTALHAEPVYDALNSSGYYSVYPPLSQLIFRFGALFYDGGWEVSYYAIKAVIAALEFGAVLLLARLVSAPVLLLYAWNPLVLVAGAGQGHGEAAMAFFLAATWYLAKRKQAGWASVCLACAGWIKLYPFFLFPFLWRRFGWRGLWPGAAAAVLLAAPFFHPSVPGNVLQSLDLYVRLFEFNAGPYYLLKEIFFLATGEDWSKQLGPFLRTVFLAGLPILYYLDSRRRWPLSRAFMVTIGAFLLLSTTVHPWYLVPMLLLGLERPSWHWHWVGVLSIGTYLLYVGGPYWVWVVLGWGGFAVFAAWLHRRSLLDGALRLRAIRKARLIGPYLPRSPLPVRLLDLGAGEGFVAERLVKVAGADAHLADVLEMNRTSLPFTLIDGERLPFRDDAFDVTTLVYVLHHARDPEGLLREAARVSTGRVVILESVYRSERGRLALRFLDLTANRLRAGGRTEAMESSLHFRNIDGWRATFRKLGLRELEARDLGGFVHPRALFVVEKLPAVYTQPSISERTASSG